MKKICLLIIALSTFCCVKLGASDTKQLAGKQIDLCMIGDSITWWGEGDCFRAGLLKQIPELAFVGTHTAKFGYSHAGEGGNGTKNVLARLDDPERVPPARYYHLLIGINDSANARSEEMIAPRARLTADNIKKILDNLCARPYVDKVFLGMILPCSIEGKVTPEALKRFDLRDRTGSKTNEILRQEVSKYGNKVVIIEYEQALRPLEERKTIIRLHPNAAGYEKIVAVAAPVIRKHAKADSKTIKKPGVEVNNLWNDSTKTSKGLIPGWFTLSFKVNKINASKINITVKNTNVPKKDVYRMTNKKFTLSAKQGERTFVNVYTAISSPLTITVQGASVSDIMLEKMRPSKKPSVYGKGKFIDTTSAFMPGELLVEAAPAPAPAPAKQSPAVRIPQTPATGAVQRVMPHTMRTINKAYGSHNSALEEALR